MEQIPTTLPRSEWEDIHITENNEPLVEIEESENIQYASLAEKSLESRTVRVAVYEKLKKVARCLPYQYKLVIIEGYRSITSQQHSWDRMWQKIKTAYPLLSDEEIEKKVRLYVAKPSPLANHNCGGAIDVTLAYTNGTLVEMGTLHPSEEDSTDAIPRFTMFSKDINTEQASNRTILRDAMVAGGFVWYPNEWWHYCYGDRMWAVYTNQKECIYGPINLQ